MMKLIEVENVSKSFDGLNVLDSVSLSVSSGENLSIVGPSGVGKSTLLRLIAGLDDVDSGLINLFTNKLSSEYKVASVVVTHQLSTIRRTSKRVLMLCFGKIVLEGPPDKFLSTDNPYVKQFVNAELEGPIRSE